MDLQRADEMFAFVERPSSSSLITGTWTTESDTTTAPVMLSTAAAQWELVITRQRGELTVMVRGPEAEAAPAPVPLDAEFFGIQFRLGTFLPGVDLRRLVGTGLALPTPTPRSFRLGGDDWELPTPDNADVFVDRLLAAGLLVHDPVAAAVVAADAAADEVAQPGERPRLSSRSIERRVARATGLTRGTIRQIRRAERAVALLSSGVAPLDVVHRLGYADQPHLTRSLRRFVGTTPAQVVRAPTPAGTPATASAP
ncbi:MAG TPA: AraC family transcriptional regulator [Acidimicrobiales bacterium]